MLGLGSTITKSARSVPTIVSDSLVLKHGYNAGAVEPCSTGAADINADAAANEYIDVGTTTNIGTSDVSFSAWVYITSFVDYGGIFCARKDDGSKEGFEVRTMNESTIEVILDDGGSSTSMVSSALNTNQWYHVGASIDRNGGTGGAQLYINGVEDGADNPNDEQTSIGSIGITTKIGQQNETENEMRGYICNVGYWLGTALTKPQVKSIMLKDYAGLSASEKTSLVSWWNLDSVIPASATQSPQTVAVYDNHYGGGSELGSELWDTPWSTDGSTEYWSAYDDNTVSTVNGALQITHGGGNSGDHAAGANLSLRNSTILSENLVVGSVYKIVYDIKVNTGTVTGMINDGGSSNMQSLDVSSSNYVTQVIYFKRGTNIPYFKLGHDFAAGQVVTLDNFSLKQVNGNTGILS